MKNKKQIISVCTLFFSFGLTLTALAWTGPTATPPGGNTTAPINTSNSAQTKYGFLSLPKLFDSNDESYYLDPDTNSWLYRLYSYDIRSSIFYDNDDTAYYVDPASTSVFNIVNLGGVARTTWPDGGGTSLWSESGTDIYRESGNIGIGTAAPGAKLHVAGGEVRIPGGSGDVSGWQTSFNYSGAGYNYIRGTTIIADNGGNVGIGTTAPGAPLEVFKDGAAADTTGGGVVFSRYQSGGSYRGSSIFHRYISGLGDTMLFSVSDSANPYISGTGALDSRVKMVITTTGNVGIGTAAPTQKLDVAGNITANLMYDRDNAGYYVDPHWISRLNAVYPNSIKMYGDLDLNGKRITGGQALDGQVCQIAVYASIEGGGIKWNYATWIDSSGWQRLGTGGGAIIDSQKIYNIAIKCK